MTRPGQTPSLPRFFCPSLPVSQGGQVSDAPCALDKAESHHARNVLRLSVGDAVELFDGRGSFATASIKQFDAGRAVCRVDAVQHAPAVGPSLTIASAVPKGPRADAMVDQLSQLGVDRFIPLSAEHSVAVPKPSKIEKFSRAAVESAKQCGRRWLMCIDRPISPAEVWSDKSYGLKLLAAPSGDPLADLPDRLRACGDVLVLIGPEGGWGADELASAREAGCVMWSIAPNILRIETAATAAAAILRYPGVV
jgi:16S rRNA (uracil1498-N3)-methyltransferase